MTAPASPAKDFVDEPLPHRVTGDDAYGPVLVGGSSRPLRRVALLAVCVVLIAGGAVLAASSVPTAEPPVASRGLESRPSPEPAPGTAPERLSRALAEKPETLESPARWRPGDDEVYPNAKRLAAVVAQRLATYPQGSSPRGVSRAVARKFETSADRLLGAARELVRGEFQSAGTVVYPQLGGLTPTAASVMVVIDQELLDATGGRRVERRTLDVRLRLADGEWALDGVASGGGVPVDRPRQLSPEAAAVLDHPSVVLSDSARWDIYGAGIATELLALIARVADRHQIAVATLSTGHPLNVFATDRQSNHTKGRAVDIYSIDGEPVVSQRTKGSAAHRLTGWLFDRGVPELGSPWALDGYGGRSFTDDVHLDHLHVGV